MAALDHTASTSKNSLPTGSRPHMAESVEEVGIIGDFDVRYW
jgi:hypothetical protein